MNKIKIRSDNKQAQNCSAVRDGPDSAGSQSTRTYYAYRNKRNYMKCGLLDAIDFKDAARHLGSGYFIKKCEVSGDDWWDFICSEIKERSNFIEKFIPLNK